MRVFEKLGDAPDALGVGRQVDGVGDGEVVVALVNEQRNAVGDLVVEELGDLEVGFFGGVRGKVGEVAPALVVVDVKVLGLHVAPFGRAVLHLVLPKTEVLSLGR